MTANQIVGIDIGSGTIKAIIGEIELDGTVNVIGMGKSPSKGGLKKGNVVSISQTVKAIKDAVDAATNMATSDAVDVVITISGDHIRSVNSKGVIAINDEEITQDDIDKALQKCKDSFISQNKEIIHIIPQEYMIDEQRGVRQPVGMTGSSLEVQVHVVMANLSSTKNLINCVNKNNLNVQGMIFAPIASAWGVLTTDEKELGVTVLDIGYGTSTLTVYKEGSLLFSHILPVGGYNITNDLALSLQIPIDAAERLKTQYGCAMSSEVNQSQMVEASHGHEVSLQMVSEVIEARVSEMFLLIKEDLKKANLLHKIPSGIVLTGGTANLNGIQNLAEMIFQTSIRIGFPHQDIRGLTDLVKHPEYGAAIGLLHYAKENKLNIPGKGDGKKLMHQVKDIIKKWF